MQPYRTTLTLAIICLTIGYSAVPGLSAELSIVASHDATIFSQSPDVSAGQGDLFVGLNNDGSRRRRALVRFDLGNPFPMWATIDSARLTMWVNRSEVADRTVTIHRVTSDWNEGNGPGGGGDGDVAVIGDVTWKHTFYNTQFWNTEGGDFVASASASATVGTPDQSYSWGNASGMVDDIRLWSEKPDSNFGWILKGDEGQRSSKRFDSRQSAETSRRPTLRIWYTPFANCSCPRQGDMDASTALDAVDLNILIDALYFGGDDPQDGNCPTMRTDVNSDGALDMTDLDYLVGVLFFNGTVINPCSL